MRRLGKPTREWVSADGVRCAHVDDPELAGELMVDMRDLAKFIGVLDLSSIADPVRRTVIARFQREVAALEPAAAHRRAIALLEDLGANLSDDFKRPLVRAVKDGEMSKKPVNR